MVGEIFAGISAFGEMLGIAKALRDMDDTVKRNAAVYDLSGKDHGRRSARYGGD